LISTQNSAVDSGYCAYTVFFGEEGSKPEPGDQSIIYCKYLNFYRANAATQAMPDEVITTFTVCIMLIIKMALI
jgi:hypothetical protein